MNKLILFLFLFPVKIFSQDGGFSFSLPVAAKTSAGVFSPDSMLVRTLWSNKQMPAGKSTAFWDGKDDFGQPLVSPLPSYIIKVLFNNVQYKWEGACIGNTSDSMTGESKHRGYYSCMTGLAFAANGYGYFCNGFSEGDASIGKFLITTPNSKKVIFPSGNARLITLNTEFVVTDNKNVYYAGYDSYSRANSMVHAISTSDDTETRFANGESYTVTHGKVYPSVISKMSLLNARITGLAVQKKGIYLFVARAGLNQLQSLNKITGQLAQTISFPSARALAIDEKDNLWMVTENNKLTRYLVKEDGSLTPGLALEGLTDPLAVEAGNGLVAVADGGNIQQVKFFNSSTGALSNVLGEPGGYFNDPTVSNNKFYFNDARGKDLCFITFQPDGSFWVNDPGNFRVQHYSSSRTFINRIMSLGSTYSVWVDPNNPSRVWAEYLEFSIDYKSPLSGKSGWTLVKNWGANISTEFDKSEKFRYITTLKNGRTYSTLRSGNRRQMVEFPSSGPLRLSGVYRTGPQILIPDGSLQGYSKGSVMTGRDVSVIRRFPLTRFDEAGNPVWSETPEILATTPVLTPLDPNDDLKGNCLTSTNKVIIWNPDKQVSANILYKGYHLGAIKRGTNNWLWRTELATTLNYKGAYPNAGYFDIGNGVHNNAGGTLSIVGNNLITSYHGEFWKNTQTNKYNHYLDDGLAVGQFGVVKEETNGESPAMYAGNALTPMAVADPNSPNSIYLYHGDESTHSGVHRWKISGLNTITEKVIPIAYPAKYIALKPDYTNLMEGLPFDVVLEDNTAGWKRSPSNEEAGWTIVTNYYVYDRLADRDLRLNFTKPTAQTYTLSRDLGTNTVKSFWKITGDIAWEGKDGGRSSIQIFLEVLDAHDKVLTSVNYNQNFLSRKNELMANGKILSSMAAGESRNMTKYFRPIELSVNKGLLTISYNGSKVVANGVMENSADWRSPKTIRIRCVSNPTLGPVTNKSINLGNFKFYKD